MMPLPGDTIGCAEGLFWACYSSLLFAHITKGLCEKDSQYNVLGCCSLVCKLNRLMPLDDKNSSIATEQQDLQEERQEAKENDETSTPKPYTTWESERRNHFPRGS
ncbi:MAG: hypothetical protein KKD01_13230 [Proteobacteria bacterium]|nr:hypothetical protein [Pseudomonadota bacterium]MBU1418895.1 hypothetical protein [Pseudomonadota bacterium]MBU1455681.1 hypothetical protein [Pseudomonadota bacterium]